MRSKQSCDLVRIRNGNIVGGKEFMYLQYNNFDYCTPIIYKIPEVHNVGYRTAKYCIRRIP